MPVPKQNAVVTDTHIERVRECMSAILACPIDAVSAQVERVSTRQGKMLRPRLVLLAGEAAGEIRDLHFELAAIVELVHMATLLHDDVIDQAQTRRNAQSAGLEFGNELAVLTGDFLVTKVFAWSVATDSQAMQQLLANVAVRLCQGEMLQSLKKQQWDLSEAQYIEIIRDKTGSLFECSCCLGAMAAGADESRVEAMSLYGVNFGLAYQILDDLIDIVGDEMEVGKTLGRDLEQGKPTLPLIHLLSSVGQSQKPELIQQLGSMDEPEKLATLLQEAGSLAYAQETIVRYVHEAKRWLGVFPGGDAVKELTTMADVLADRAGS